MNRFQAWGYALLASALCFALLFANPLAPLGILMIGTGRLGLPYWPVVVLACMALCLGLTFHVLRRGLPGVFAPGFFCVTSIGLSTLVIGVWATMTRDQIVTAFAPDVEFRAPFLASLRNAPQEFQFFLHGAALKDCRPYGWSYREMAFYELPANAAVNVLPASWLAQCGIRPTP